MPADTAVSAGATRPRRARRARELAVELRGIGLERAGRTVLRQIDWRIRPGERWVLAGPNGAGKTQLLKLVAGAVWPTPDARARRRYRLDGELFATPGGVQEEIAYLGAERQDKYERYGWNHSVEAVVGTGLHRTDLPLEALGQSERRRIAQLLARFGIESLATRPFLTLSYGERRLVLLARALAARPGLLLLDEPFDGLDAAHRAALSRWLDTSARSRLPWVVATHRATEVPRATTHALVLEQGRIVHRGAWRGRQLPAWFEGAAARAPAAPAVLRTARMGVRQAGPPRVRLRSARVYLEERCVLGPLDLCVRAGDCWVVHGGNGAGKTTLLRTLYGDHGVAIGGGIERGGIASGVPLEQFRRRVGLVAPHLHADHLPALRAQEMVVSGARASIGLDEPASRTELSRARAALAAFGLLGCAQRRVGELSYGQMRRALFARAWLSRPRLLLLDEPFSGLDAATRRALTARLDALAARGAAIVLATHERGDWPAAVTHELELDGGRASYCGPVRAAPGGARCRARMSGRAAPAARR